MSDSQVLVAHSLVYKIISFAMFPMNMCIAASSAAVDAVKRFAGYRLPVVVYIQPELADLPEVQDALERLSPWSRRIIRRR